jgi:2Fe-2S ferredoxin
MAMLTVTTRDGEVHRIEGAPGKSVMEIIRGSGIDEILALCGGCLSCATCHVHVDRDWIGRLDTLDEDESDLLDSSAYRNDQSRLSCQIRFSEALDGLTVAVAPED